MRVAVLGGGPAGLFFAISLKLKDPAHSVTVVERNRPDDTFGWGVVLSDETLGNLNANDPESAELIRKDFVYWDDIAVHYRKSVVTSTVSVDPVPSGATETASSAPAAPVSSGAVRGPPPAPVTPSALRAAASTSATDASRRTSIRWRTCGMLRPDTSIETGS